MRGMSTLFDLSFLTVAPFWLLMIALPRWRVTAAVIASPWIAAPAAALYVALILPGIPATLATLARPTLDTIAPLLSTPEGVTGAWVHFLAFDLFVGRWIFLDARTRGVTPWIASPLIALTLMLGPFGLLGYLIARAFVSRARA